MATGGQATVVRGSCKIQKMGLAEGAGVKPAPTTTPQKQRLRGLAEGRV